MLELVKNIQLITEKEGHAPLIHCITNPIAINDCANAVLAVGAKPIMAEHPEEVEEITMTANALAVNLGNITDARMESMMRSGKVALAQGIPTIIDVVGVSCSKLRLNYARTYIKEMKPNVIKGNLSEIKALMGVPTTAIGVDVSTDDAVNDNNLDQILELLSAYSKQTDAVILASGKRDLIVYKDMDFGIDNGVAQLGQITGTGCMLNVLVASFLSCNPPLESAIYATALMGIAGELAETSTGTGTFRIKLMDNFSTLTRQQVLDKIKGYQVEV